MRFIVAEKPGPHGILLIVTDKDIFGKKFEEGKLQLDLTKDFYKGKEQTFEEVEKSIQIARHLHLTGENTVTIGIKMSYVDSKRVLKVQGIPHAQVVIEGN